jgi:hypothetical protein
MQNKKGSYSRKSEEKSVMRWFKQEGIDVGPKFKGMRITVTAANINTIMKLTGDELPFAVGEVVSSSTIRKIIDRRRLEKALYSNPSPVGADTAKAYSRVLQSYENHKIVEGYTRSSAVVPNASPITVQESAVTPAPVKAAAEIIKDEVVASAAAETKAVVNESAAVTKMRTVDKLLKFSKNKNVFYIGLAAMGAALTINVIRDLTYNPVRRVERPMREDREYSDFGSPVNLSRAIQRSSDYMNQLPRTGHVSTMGLTQQLHRNAINHQLVGNGRVQDQFNRLYNFNGTF